MIDLRHDQMQQKLTIFCRACVDAAQFVHKGYGKPPATTLYLLQQQCMLFLESLPSRDVSFAVCVCVRFVCL